MYYFYFKEGKLDDSWFPQENDVTIEGTGSFVETWKAMEKLVQKGLVKSIGVSNFNKKQIEDILGVATIKPVTNQVCIKVFTFSSLSNYKLTLNLYKTVINVI